MEIKDYSSALDLEFDQHSTSCHIGICHHIEEGSCQNGNEWFPRCPGLEKKLPQDSAELLVANK